MAETTLDPAAPLEAAKPQLQKRTAPIVPERSVAGRTLVLLIAIMTFLSGVTLGGVVLVQKSAIAWSSDVGREVTISTRIRCSICAGISASCSRNSACSTI
jgi:cell division protein FtsX